MKDKLTNGFVQGFIAGVVSSIVDLILVQWLKFGDIRFLDSNLIFYQAILESDFNNGSMLRLGINWAIIYGV